MFSQLITRKLITSSKKEILDAFWFQQTLNLLLSADKTRQTKPDCASSSVIVTE